MPATKKRPPKAMDPEMEEQYEEEGVREGEDDMPPRAKRKGKRTKAPMDGGMYMKKPMDGEGCSCGRRKSKCDGSCGKKMDRNDALSPQEYLAACELGIQGRPRPYIRARLDATERLDLKCGKGAISPGEKCTKGAATKAQGPSRKSVRPSIRRGIGKGAKYGAVINGIAGAAQGAFLGSMGGPGGAVAGAVIGGAVNAATGAVLGGAIGGGVNAVRRSSYTARRRSRGYADSIYAIGFSPEYDRLAI